MEPHQATLDDLAKDQEGQPSDANHEGDKRSVSSTA
jgi:hypothetical protein